MSRWLLLFLLASVAVGSCRYDCGRATLDITLVGFSSDETDSLIVKKYSKESNFNELVDTFLVTSATSSYMPRNDSLQIASSLGGDGGFISDYDYEIILAESNEVFQVTNINENFRTGGGGCTKVYCLNSIDSYILDGQLIQELDYRSTIYLNK